MRGPSPQRRRPRLRRSVPPWLIAAMVVCAGAGAMSLAQPAGEPPAGEAPAAGEAPPPGAGQPGQATEEKKKEMSLFELLVLGGWFMVPIGLCSLLGLAVIIERFIALRRSAIIPAAFMEGLKGVLRHTVQDRQAGLEHCHAHECPIARVAAAGIRKMHKDEESVEQAIEDAGANEVAKLRRNLRMLYGVAAVAPMLGLLGTVWGMIEAFQVAAEVGLGQAQAMAKGIYVALVTTFAGLCVAIPILIFYYYFQGKIERIVSEMNDASVDFLEHYTREEVVSAAPAAG